MGVELWHSLFFKTPEPACHEISPVAGPTFWVNLFVIDITLFFKKSTCNYSSIWNWSLANTLHHN